MEDILAVKAYVVCKTVPPSCFCCKYDILWVVRFLQNRDDMLHYTCKTFRLHFFPPVN